MTDDEKLLLNALAWMCVQYLGDGLDHQCMGAGEDAVDLLIRYGLATPFADGRRGAEWTEAGQRLLDSN
jgi:hypothetical protein